ncbi:D-alanyl-D-alanine carboxypeptidase [Streptomyces sp. NPDC048330]|uniref:D-alanyl-D-alanine carboxypeptidase n=1 Tax=Streptomyces sp. NPDC048330 TaxID=3365533 RepID=UPI0037143AE8
MAGESPDRAEQQGSSQETVAPGGGRDPRLSVLRESEPPSSAPAPRVEVDQPTAVFKNLAPRTPDDDAPKPTADDAPEPAVEDAADVADAAGTPASEGSDSPDAAADPEPESARLKAAVAAWVATADAPRGDGGTGEGEQVDEADEAPGAAEAAADAPESAEDASGAPQGAPEAAVAASGAAEASLDATGPSADAPASVDAPEGDEPDAGPEDDEDETEPESDEEAGDEGEPDDEAEPEADDEGDEEPVEDRAAAETPAGDGAPAGGKAADASWFAARKPSADAGVETDAKPAADAKAADEPADAEPDAESGDESGDDTPVDQPTAMFKMIRPPVVDQPTTALKLPASLTGNPDSERTSTFLPLRPDIPAERASQEAAAAPAAPKAPATPSAPKEPERKAAPVPPPAAVAEPERTRQQPLPPLPPLDLLAELTNTPPPPPNALRTTVRRLRIWTPLVLLLLIVFAIVQMVRPLPAPVLTLSAAPTYSFAGGPLNMPWPNEGQGAVEVEGVGSMGLYGPQKPAPIASVTKTMTAYVILRDHPIKGKAGGPEITVDKKAADQAKAAHESTAHVQEGQTYTERELLELLMIPSANNVARLLARWDAGSEAAFVVKMNAAAKELGMTQSTYTDPSGLLDSTVSTPQDQLKLAKAVMQYDVFREIVNMPNVTVDGISGRIENNNNILLEPGVSGIKTGSSTPAGGNLLWSANTVVDGQNRRILGIVMGAKDAEQLNDKLQLAIDNSLKLIQQAQKDVTSAAVVKKGQVLGYVDDGLGGRTPVVATKELKAIGWPGLKVKLELTDGGKALPHSAKAGDIVGQVSIGTGAGKVSSPVALQGDLVEPGFDKKLTRVG